MSEAAGILLAAVNLISFILYGIDKRRAKRGLWRIPESVLILSVILGGGIGGWLGMRIFHHKTRKPLFAIGVPAVTMMEYAVLAVSVWNRMGH